MGGTAEVTVGGTDLDGLQELRFSNAGITASLKTSNRFEVRISSQVAPGIYDAWTIGKWGASNPRAFAVGALQEIGQEKTSADTPQNIPLECTVDGQVEASTVHYFRFRARQGQRVLIRCDAQTLDSKLEPVMELHDSTGSEVSRGPSVGMLDYTVRVDGDLTLRLHDLTYRGGPEYFYRLSVGTFPHIDYMLPVKDGPGAKTTFAIFGRNLPGGKIVDQKMSPALERLEVELEPGAPGVSRALTTLPAQSSLDLYEYRIRNERGTSEAALFQFPSALVVAEQEPNDTSATARLLTVPCEIAGTLHPSGDRDWFSLTAKKGEVFWIKVFSHRLGGACDPFVLVQRATTNGATDVLELNDSDANIGGAEFNTTHRDPSGRWEVKEDGRYLIQVRDLYTQPRHRAPVPYQLIIQKPSPDFRLTALPATPLPANKDAKNIPIGTTALRRGETLALKVLAFRHDGFDGPIELTVENLPQGVAALPARLEAGKTSTLILLHATEDAPPVTGSWVIKGTALLGGTSLVHQASAASLSWSVADPAADAVTSRKNAHGLVSVMDELAPLRIEPSGAEAIAAVAGSKVKVSLRCIRDGEFTGVLKLKAVGVPALESVKEFDLDPKATNIVYELDLGAQKVAPGHYTFALQGLATGKPMKAAQDGKKTPGKDASFTVYSTPIQLHVVAPPAGKTNSPAK